MKILENLTYTVVLTKEEFEALMALVENTSERGRMYMGLTYKDSKLFSDIYQEYFRRFFSQDT